MIGVIFQFANSVIEIRVVGSNILFRTQETGSMLAPIDALQLNQQGVIKEHPDLKDKEDWREQAIKRFKEKMKTYQTEKERINYVIEDLSKFGYKAYAIQEQGFRTRKL
jgi:hypothetical protein